MTLDEAIKKQRKIAKEKYNNAVYIMDNMKSDIAMENAEDYKRCAEEHRQLAKWLTDYKRLLEQEPKTGHWEWLRCDMYICSECMNLYTDLSGIKDRMNYCPNCGSKNEVEE